MAKKLETGDMVYDALTAFLGGVNSGLNPILLRRDQLAFATNATVRGGYISSRPPYRKLTFVFDPPTIQDAFETNFFQGATTYRPDFGNHLLLASISGAIYKLVIAGNTVTVTDVSIAGDPNPALTSQVWMWQGEKWVIINNGINLPLIFDGTVLRRSYGPSQLLAEATAAVPASPPPIGDIVTLTLVAPYTGPFNIPVQFNNAFYEAKSVASTGYPAILTNNGETPGTIVPAGTPIYSIPGLLGYLADPAPFTGLNQLDFDSGDTFAPASSVCSAAARGKLNFFILPASSQSLVPGGAVCDSTSGTSGYNCIANNPFTIFVGGYVFDVYTACRSGSGATDWIRFQASWTVEPSPVPFFQQLPPGTPMYLGSSTAPTTLIGNTVADYVVPAVGADVDIFIDRAYTGAADNAVWVNLKPYFISPAPNPIPSATLFLLNLSDKPQTPAVNYDFSSPLPITSVPEFPPGRMGAYGMGRNWMSLTDGISFIAGNIVGGEAGTQAESLRDSVLKTTENDYLDTGSFRLPSSGDVITAMTFTTTLDTSLGQGPLQVFTATNAFSVNAPVDRTEWQNLEFPILTQSLIGIGALAQQSLFAVNSDSFFRSLVGWYSLIQARRNVSEQWGNTPMTREMERVLNQESKPLLPYVSGCQFDNRALFSAVPQSTGQGVASVAIVAMNLDPFSSLASKSPPVYDGVWQNLNTLQLLRAVIDSVDRAFAFAVNSETHRIELWELLGSSNVGEVYTPATDRTLFDNDGTEDTRIEWSFETSVMLKEVAGMPLLKLEGGEIYVEDVVGEVDVTVQWKPDSYPCFTDWIKFSICAQKATTAEPNLKPGFKSKAGFGEPPSDCDPYSNTQLRFGHRFQLKFLFRGHLRFLGCKIGASIQPELPLAKPECRPQGTTPES